MNRRVKRHWIFTRTLQHGRPAEIKPDRTIFTQGLKILPTQINYIKKQEIQII